MVQNLKKNNRETPPKISLEVWEEYKKTKDTDIRNTILMEYVGVVKCIANQMRGMYKNFAQLDDVVNEGVIVLMDAIEKFDCTKGVKFETFASVKIRGAIIDYIRKQDWVPRNVRKTAKDIEKAYNELRNTLDREPTDVEIAEKIGITVMQLNKAYIDSYGFNVVSYEELLQESIYDGISPTQLKDDNGMPEDKMQKKELRDVIATAIDELSERQKIVVSLYYYENLKLKEIAKVLGVSESRVCQMHSTALIKLKSAVKDYTK